MKLGAIQTAIRMFFPAQGILCREPLDRENALCGPCWRKMPFIDGSVCNKCGTPILGDIHAHLEDTCEDCHDVPPPWDWGRAALAYEGEARKLILAFKHGDRQEIAIAGGFWMAQRVQGLIAPDAVLCPIPLHWRRKLSRRYNQAEFLAREMARHLNVAVRTDLIVRPRPTIPLEAADQTERHARLAGAFDPHPAVFQSPLPREVILVDDVMTSGATLSAAAQCLSHAGVIKINIVVLARVGRNG